MAPLTAAVRDARGGQSRGAHMTGTIYLLILVVAFVGIVIWVYDRKRKARFEAEARIPFDDDHANRS